MSVDDENTPATGKGAKRTWFIVGGVAVILLIAAVVIFVSVQGNNEAEVDRATMALEEASATLTEVDRLNEAADALGESKGQKAKGLSTNATNQLEETLTEVQTSDDPYPTLESALTSAVKAGQEISRLSGQMVEAQALIGKPDDASTDSLKTEAKAAMGIVNGEITVANQLNGVLADLSVTISDAAADLEAEGAMSDESQARVDDTNRAIEEATREQDAKKIEDQVSGAFDELAGSLENLVVMKTTVVGPHDCGPDEAGAQIVINQGRTSCANAKFVSGNSTGPNSSTGPAGWDCSGFATNLKGETLSGTDGYSCSKGNVVLSFFSPDAEPVSSTVSIGDALGFVSPSKNIVCTFGFEPGSPVSASCYLAEERTWPLPPRPAGCPSNLDWNGYLTVNYQKSGFECGGSVLDPDTLPVLAYGTKVQREAIECTSARNGVTCKNLEKGFGFRVASGDYDLDP